MVTWLKRYVDNDTRYEQFMCPPPTSTDYSAWEDTCPGGDEGPGTPPTTVPPGGESEWWEWWCDWCAATAVVLCLLTRQFTVALTHTVQVHTDSTMGGT
jgi:hypothetical protein